MKIAFLNDMIYDYAFQGERDTWPTGGAERQQWMVARALAQCGWDVTVGVRRPELGAGGTMHPDGVQFVDIGRGHILAAWYQFFRSERPDWWFWQCASHLFGFGVALAKVFGVKTIFAAGVDRDVFVRRALYHKPRWWPAYAFGLWRTDRIVLQHRGQQEDLRRGWQKKSSVVPNIICSTHPALPRSQRTNAVAWVAALRVAKRPDRLVEIARLLPDVRFVVCGSKSTYMTPRGYSDAAIEAFTSTPNIEYRGQISPQDALRLARESALLLSTSVEEGFPQTFLEAWSAGTPVVTLGIDPDGVISGEPLGAVCRNVSEAAGAIARLLQDEAHWTSVSDRARQHVARAHSPAAAIAALERSMGATGAGVQPASTHLPV